MKKITLLILCILPLISLKGQTNLPFQEGFSSGLPAGWSQYVGQDAPSWSFSQGYAEIEATQANPFVIPEVYLVTPWLNTTTVTNPALLFDVTLTDYSGPCAPTLSVQYSTDGTTWSTIASMGSNKTNCPMTSLTITENGSVNEILLILPSLSSVKVRFRPYFGTEGAFTLDNPWFEAYDIVPTDLEINPTNRISQTTSNTLMMDVEMAGTIKLLDINGRIVLTKMVSPKSNLDLSTLIPGVYGCWYESEDGSIVLRDKIMLR